MTAFRRLAMSLAVLFAALSSPVSALRSDGDIIEWSAAQLDAYYTTLAALQGVGYETPGLVVIAPGESASSPCGEFDDSIGAAYCRIDATIYLADSLMAELADSDDALPALVLAHEWAHHVTASAGVGAYVDPINGEWTEAHTIENELRADCMAGVWFRSLDNRALLDGNDLSAALAASYEAGDSGMLGRGLSHGTGEERLRAVLFGYESGIAACMAITPLPRLDGNPQSP